MAEGICNEAVSKGETHKGHRERLRHRFFREGLSSFEDHNALELLLFYAIPRKDTNPIAHELIRRFGTLENVLEAPVEELERVESIGESAALFLKLCHSVALRYCANRGTELAGTAFDYKLTGDYLLRRFEKSDREEVYVIFYDRDMIYSGETLLHQGSISSASFSLRDLADAVSFYKASFVAVEPEVEPEEVLPEEVEPLTVVPLASANSRGWVRGPAEPSAPSLLSFWNLYTAL